MVLVVCHSSGPMVSIAATITGTTNTAAMPVRISRPLRWAGADLELTCADVSWIGQITRR